jgi:hypothetical protein
MNNTCLTPRQIMIIECLFISGLTVTKIAYGDTDVTNVLHLLGMAAVEKIQYIKE